MDTSKQFFTTRAIVIIALLVLVLGVYAYKTFVTPPAPVVVDTTPVPAEQDTVAHGEPSAFTWSFEEGTTLNLDGLPETNVFLQVSYPDGATKRIAVDTTPGGCNEIDRTEKDMANGSTVAQCYAAGLGYYFKVTKGPQSYLVQRKMFEEGTPESRPPEHPYETVAEIAFSL